MPHCRGSCSTWWSNCCVIIEVMVRKILFICLVLLLVFVGYFWVGSAPEAKDITWGVNFSQKQAELLGLDWRETYTALLDDLGVRDIKLPAYWDLIEPKEGGYNFNDLDWQMQKAEEKGAKSILVIGMKTGRWPECHIPEWAAGLNQKEQRGEILEMLAKIIERYRERVSVWAWQVENEPLFPFGECPWRDKEFLKKEIELVKSLDQSRPVIISDSGEFSFWVTAAQLGDLVSATLHRKVWFRGIKTYISYPIRPIFYWRKAELIKKIFGKEVIVGELQAEPWCQVFLLGECPLEEQKKTMNLERFKKNIEFAKKTGLNKSYLWGVEWMYWMKEKQGHPEIWQEAQKLWKNTI